MELVGFELRKIFCRGLVRALVLLLLAGNLVLFWAESRSRYDYVLESRGAYDQMAEDYNAMDRDRACREILDRAAQATEFSLLEQAMQSGNQPLIDSLTQENPDLVQTYGDLEAQGRLPDRQTRLALNLLAEEARHIREYPDYIDGMTAQAEQMQKASIFHKPGTFSYRNVQKTPEDFRENRDLPLKFGPSTGILALSRFFLTDGAVLFLLLLAAERLFWEEREKGLTNLIRSAPRGRWPTAWAKVLALTLTSLALSLAFYGGNLGLAGILFGFGDPGRYVQSMSAFGGSCLRITVGQYLGLFLLGKVILSVLFALLFGAAFSLCAGSVAAAGGSLALVLGGFLAYRYIPALSALNVLKYVNPIGALDLMTVFGEYHNLNLFGYPVSRVPALAAATGAQLLFLLVLVPRRWVCRRERRRTGAWTTRLADRCRGALGKLRPMSLWALELRKLLISRGLILLLPLLALGISGQILRTEPVYDFDDGVYCSYLETLAGELTPEKEEFLRQEQQRFENIGADRLALGEALVRGELTQNQYEYEIFRLETFAHRRNGFQMVLDQYEALLDLQSRGIRAGFVNQFSERYLFGSTGREAAIGFAWILAVVCVTAVVFCQEYRGNMIRILNPTKRGKEPLFRAKLAAAGVLGLCFMALFLPEYWNAARYYPSVDGSLPVQNLEALRDLPGRLSIRAYGILSRVFQLVSMGAVLALTAVVSLRLKNQMSAMLVSAGLAALPLGLNLCGVEDAKFLPLGGAFLLYETLGAPMGWGVWLGNAAFTLGLAPALIWGARRSFCGKGGRKHGA